VEPEPPVELEPPVEIVPVALRDWPVHVTEPCEVAVVVAAADGGWPAAASTAAAIAAGRSRPAVLAARRALM
jgi:hypothetical protein